MIGNELSFLPVRDGILPSFNRWISRKTPSSFANSQAVIYLERYQAWLACPAAMGCEEFPDKDGLVMLSSYMLLSFEIGS